MNQIKTIDGTEYVGPPGLEALLAEVPSAYGYEKDMAVFDGSTGHFVWCYTAETTIKVGFPVQVGYDGYTGTSGYKSPMASIPDATGSVYHLSGAACMTLAAAGGIWVQTKGRFFAARVDGATDVALGTHLTFTAAPYWTTDHATVKTAIGNAIYEGCRHGAAGATAWALTRVDGTASYPFPSLADYPIYKYAETIAYNAQGDTTNGDPACVIYLTGVPVAI
jgi:hypothetical protein